MVLPPTSDQRMPARFILLSSPATRAQQTAEAIRAAGGLSETSPEFNVDETNGLRGEILAAFGADVIKVPT